MRNTMSRIGDTYQTYWQISQNEAANVLAKSLYQTLMSMKQDLLYQVHHLEGSHFMSTL